MYWHVEIDGELHYIDNGRYIPYSKSQVTWLKLNWESTVKKAVPIPKTSNDFIIMRRKIFRKVIK